MSEKVRYRVERKIGKNYNKKTRHALYNNLKGQGESKETALKPLTEQLRELGLDYSVHNEEYINEHYDSVIIIERIRKLIDRGVLPPDEKAYYKKIQPEQLDTIQKHFQLLSDLNEKGLKMGSNILFDIGDGSINRDQVEKFNKYGITVSDSDWLKENGTNNINRNQIQHLYNLGYRFDILTSSHIITYPGYINFKALEKLNNALGHRVQLWMVVCSSWKWSEGYFRPMLDRCNGMENFPYSGINRLREHNISLNDEDLIVFKGTESEEPEEVNIKNFQALLDNNIKPKGTNCKKSFLHIQHGNLDINDLQNVYQDNNHKIPKTQIIKALQILCQQNKNFNIETFINAYKRLDQYFQNQNPSL